MRKANYRGINNKFNEKSLFLHFVCSFYVYVSTLIVEGEWQTETPSIGTGGEGQNDKLLFWPSWYCILQWSASTFNNRIYACAAFWNISFEPEAFQNCQVWWHNPVIQTLGEWRHDGPSLKLRNMTFSAGDTRAPRHQRLILHCSLNPVLPIPTCLTAINVPVPTSCAW